MPGVPAVTCGLCIDSKLGGPQRGVGGAQSATQTGLGLLGDPEVTSPLVCSLFPREGRVKELKRRRSPLGHTHTSTDSTGFTLISEWLLSACGEQLQVSLQCPLPLVLSLVPSPSLPLMVDRHCAGF